MTKLDDWFGEDARQLRIPDVLGITSQAFAYEKAPPFLLWWRLSYFQSLIR